MPPSLALLVEEIPEDQFLVFAALALVLWFAGFFAIVALRYRRCRPDEAIVVWGKGAEGPRILTVTRTSRSTRP